MRSCSGSWLLRLFADCQSVGDALGASASLVVFSDQGSGWVVSRSAAAAMDAPTCLRLYRLFESTPCATPAGLVAVVQRPGSRSRSPELSARLPHRAAAAAAAAAPPPSSQGALSGEPTGSADAAAIATAISSCMSTADGVSFIAAAAAAPAAIAVLHASQPVRLRRGELLALPVYHGGSRLAAALLIGWGAACTCNCGGGGGGAAAAAVPRHALPPSSPKGAVQRRPEPPWQPGGQPPEKGRCLEGAACGCGCACGGCGCGGGGDGGGQQLGPGDVSELRRLAHFVGHGVFSDSAHARFLSQVAGHLSCMRDSSGLHNLVLAMLLAVQDLLHARLGLQAQPLLLATTTTSTAATAAATITTASPTAAAFVAALASAATAAGDAPATPFAAAAAAGGVALGGPAVMFSIGPSFALGHAHSSLGSSAPAIAAVAAAAAHHSGAAGASGGAYGSGGAHGTTSASIKSPDASCRASPYMCALTLTGGGGGGGGLSASCSLDATGSGGPRGGGAGSSRGAGEGGDEGRVAAGGAPQSSLIRAVRLPPGAQPLLLQEAMRRGPEAADAPGHRSGAHQPLPRGSAPSACGKQPSTPPQSNDRLTSKLAGEDASVRGAAASSLAAAACPGRALPYTHVLADAGAHLVDERHVSYPDVVLAGDLVLAGQTAGALVLCVEGAPLAPAAAAAAVSSGAVPQWPAAGGAAAAARSGSDSSSGPGGGAPQPSGPLQSSRELPRLAAGPPPPSRLALYLAFPGPLPTGQPLDAVAAELPLIMALLFGAFRAALGDTPDGGGPYGTAAAARGRPAADWRALAEQLHAPSGAVRSASSGAISAAAAFAAAASAAGGAGSGARPGSPALGGPSSAGARRPGLASAAASGLVPVAEHSGSSNTRSASGGGGGGGGRMLAGLSAATAAPPGLAPPAGGGGAATAAGDHVGSVALPLPPARAARRQNSLANAADALRRRLIGPTAAAQQQAAPTSSSSSSAPAPAAQQRLMKSLTSNLGARAAAGAAGASAESGCSSGGGGGAGPSAFGGATFPAGAGGAGAAAARRPRTDPSLLSREDRASGGAGGSSGAVPAGSTLDIKIAGPPSQGGNWWLPPPGPEVLLEESGAASAAGSYGAGGSGGAQAQELLVAAVRKRVMAALAAPEDERELRVTASRDLAGVELLEVLGRGGQGVVFRGTLHGLEAAVKVLAQPPSAEQQAAGGEAAAASPGGQAGDVAAVGVRDSLAAAPAKGRAPGDAEAESQLRRAKRSAMEVTVTAALSHPNIVQVYGCFSDAVVIKCFYSPGAATSVAQQLRLCSADDPVLADRDPSQISLNEVLALEFCDAGTLLSAAWVGAFRAGFTTGAGEGAIWPALVPLYTSLLEVALALRYLHSRGLVHGDIKPQNVLLRSSARDPRGWICKLSDFGCARLLGEADAEGRRSFQMASPLGTVTHMSPECFINGAVLGAEVDVYAFGIMMWELLMCRKPYQGVKVEELPKHVVRARLRPVFHALAPEPYKALAERCFAQNPRRRPTSANLVSELQALLAEAQAEPGATPAVAPPPRAKAAGAAGQPPAAVPAPRAMPRPPQQQHPPQQQQAVPQLLVQPQPQRSPLASNPVPREAAARGAHGGSSIPPPRTLAAVAGAAGAGPQVGGGAGAFRPPPPQRVAVPAAEMLAGGLPHGPQPAVRPDSWPARAPSAPAREPGAAGGPAAL